MPSSSSPLRAAVIGFGLGGKVFHCPFIEAVPGLELAAIVQRRGDEAALAYPNARILRSAEEAFADPNLDLIVVTTPNDSHVAYATAALQAAKHVVVDKPLAATAAEARALVDLAASKGLILAPFHNRRFDNDYLTLTQLFAAGTLGRIVEINSHFDRFRPDQRQGWKEAAGPSAGLLYDLGSHLIDQAIGFFGAPDRITASVRREREKTDIDDAFTVTLEFDRDGHTLRYLCHGSMIAADFPHRFLVHGTGGSYSKHGLDPQEPTLLSGVRPPVLGGPQPWALDAPWGALILPVDPTAERIQLQRQPVPNIPGDYRLYYANVRDAILGHAPLAIPSEDGYRTIRLLELAIESSQQRRTLDVTF